jgi:CHAD domain-containing protein
MEPGSAKIKDIKPAISGYIRNSLAMLRREPVPSDKVIHDVRVLMKKARSAIKLSASQMDQVYVRKDIMDLREVGRKMCHWRESTVLRKELKKFEKEFPGIFTRLADNDKINAILREPEAEGSPSEDIMSELEEINIMLTKTGFRIRFERMNRLDPHQLFRELEMTYCKVMDIYLICRNNPRPEKLHEFRKKAKDFLYQLYFFRSLNPSGIKVLERKLDNLTQYLGKYNNLTQLVRAMEYDYSANSYPPALDELVIRIMEKQDRYLSRVWPQAFKLFRPGQKLVTLLGFKLLVL